MKKFKDYTISFAGLSLGKHQFDFLITQSFFDLFEFEQDFEHPNVNISVILDKKNNFLELFFTLSGGVEVNCDLTNEIYYQELEGKSEIIVKFGEELDDSDDEVWILPHGEYTTNISQIIYEMVLLAVPNKRIHPDVISGKSNSEMLKLLEKYSIDEETLNQSNSDESEIDPRWEALKNLNNNSN